METVALTVVDRFSSTVRVIPLPSHLTPDLTYFPSFGIPEDIVFWHGPSINHPSLRDLDGEVRSQCQPHLWLAFIVKWSMWKCTWTRKILHDWLPSPTATQFSQESLTLPPPFSNLSASCYARDLSVFMQHSWEGASKFVSTLISTNSNFQYLIPLPHSQPHSNYSCQSSLAFWLLFLC